MNWHRRLSQHGRTRLLIAGLGAALVIGLGAWLLRGHYTEPIDSYDSCAEAGYPISETSPPTCSDGFHTYRGADPAAATPQAAVTSVPFELLVDGDSGGTYPKRQEVITSQADWQRYWRNVHASLATLPPLLPVDFKTSTVLALSEGRQPTTGYNLKITSVSTTSAGTIVDVSESIPTITCKVAQVTSNRYFIASTATLAQPVSFRFTTTKHQC